MKRFKKFISVLLIFFLVFSRLGPTVVLADENTGTSITTTGEPDPSPSPDPSTSPSPTPTPTPQDVSIDNQAEVVDEITSEATSGGNLVQETSSPTPTPFVNENVNEATGEATLDIESTPCQVPDNTATEEASLEVNEATPEASLCPSPTPNDEITTGDAVSSADVENTVNTTEYNSQVQFNTLNIFVSDGIDLTNPLQIADDVFNKDQKQDPTVNVQVLENNNYAYVENNIITTANTGDNSVNDGINAIINTGDAYSILSLLNKVNTTIIGSTLHVITINIYGEVNGNIILPEFSIGDGGGCCGTSAEINNGATVENNVGSSANTGQNTIVNADNGTTTTGDASSIVNVTNIVNATIMNAIFHYLKINVIGEWTGNFLGWDDILGQLGGSSLLISSNTSGGGGNCGSCNPDLVATNEAQVINNINSSANTGGNSINGSENGTVNTGNAYSAISIYNLINTSIINSIGFLGSINIFGSLHGDIGGASLFIQDENSGDTTNQPVQKIEDSTPAPHESGGELAVYQHTNVGDYVYPGDTVTFFITVRNTGTGTVYGSKLDIGLIKGGQDTGGAVFDLGDIKPGKGYQITTGLVLAKDAEPGDYLAHVTVTGKVGPNDAEIYAYADSFLTIKALLPVAPAGLVKGVDAATPEEEVLGATTEAAGLTTEQKMELLFLALFVIYLPLKGYQRRKELAVTLVKGKKTFIKKSLALRTFLASVLY